jgi:hypothetical protein
MRAAASEGSASKGGRRGGPLALGVALGTLTGLLANLWWGPWGREAGALIALAITLALGLGTVLALWLLGHALRRLRKGSRTPALSAFFLSGCCAVIATSVIYPPSARRLPVPEPFVAQAYALHERFEESGAPWEAQLNARRTSLELSVEPASKGLGLMPADYWGARWRATYADGTRVSVLYVMGADGEAVPAKTHIAPGTAQAPALATAQALEEISRAASWLWMLEPPQLRQGPPRVRVISESPKVLEVRYPDGARLLWQGSPFFSSHTIQVAGLSPQAPCRAPWHYVWLCIP